MGYFERAEQGTIFLDEIGELDRSLQVKFLRVLEEREFEPVGGEQPIPMRARVIAATHRNLAEEVDCGRFRSDLFYRLRVIEIRIPALRERAGDIALLADGAVMRLAAELDRPVPLIAPDFIDRLTDHSWPGNVRELLNVIEAVLVRTGAEMLHARHLDDLLPGAERVVAERVVGAPPRREARQVNTEEERLYLMRHLIETGGNVARVARRMGMSRSTARYKISRYELSHLIPRD